MKNKNDKYMFWIIIVSIICITLIFISLYIMIGWINSPTEFVIKMEMDNNTLEAFKSINYTALNYTK